MSLKDAKAARERLRAAAAGVVFHEGTVALPAEPLTAQQVADPIGADDMGHGSLLLRESLNRYLQGSISRMGLKWETIDGVEEAILVKRSR